MAATSTRNINIQHQHYSPTFEGPASTNTLNTTYTSSTMQRNPPSTGMAPAANCSTCVCWKYYNVLPSQATNITILAPAPAMQDTEVKKQQQVEPIQPRPQQQVKPIKQESLQPRPAHHQHFGPSTTILAATALATQEKIPIEEKITMACWKLIRPGTFLDDLPLEMLRRSYCMRM